MLPVAHSNLLSMLNFAKGCVPELDMVATIRFSQDMSDTTFDDFVDVGLRDFGVSGYGTRLGPTKLHMSAIDVRNWNPFLLEASSQQLVLVFGRSINGHSGDTLSRFVENIRRHVDLDAEVFVNSKPFQL